MKRKNFSFDTENNQIYLKIKWCINTGQISNQNIFLLDFFVFYDFDLTKSVPVFMIIE